MKTMLEWFAQYAGEVAGYRYDGKGMSKVAGSFLKKLQDSDSKDICDFEECLRTCKSRKEKYKNLLLDFYEYYQRNTGIELETDLGDKVVIDNPVLRRIEIIKYLQNHKKTTAQIADIFLLDERTIREDLAALEEGIQIGGTELRIDIERDGWEKYMETSRHPVILNLDMPCIVAMTDGLLKVAKTDSLYSRQFRSVAREIYSGLTDYAKWRMKELLERDGLKDELEEVTLYEKSLSDSIITMMKSGQAGTIGVHADGVDYLFTDCRVNGCDGENIELSTKKGTVTFHVSDVYLCDYTLNREDTLE